MTHGTLVCLECHPTYPGIALLRRTSDNHVLDQFPLSKVKDLLGGRKKGYWIARLDSDGWTFSDEVPAEDVQ